MPPVYEWSEPVQADVWADFNLLPYCLPIWYVSHQFDHNNSIQDCDRDLTKVKGTVAETFSVACLVCLRCLQGKINAMITNWRLGNWWRMESCVSGTVFLCLNSSCFIQNIPIFPQESFDDKLILLWTHLFMTFGWHTCKSSRHKIMPQKNWGTISASSRLQNFWMSTLTDRGPHFQQTSSGTQNRLVITFSVSLSPFSLFLFFFSCKVVKYLQVLFWFLTKLHSLVAQLKTDLIVGVSIVLG